MRISKSYDETLGTDELVTLKEETSDSQGLSCHVLGIEVKQNL